MIESRQARKAAALLQVYPTADPEAEARLQKEAEREEKTINRICDELGVQIHEVRCPAFLGRRFWKIRFTD